MHDVQGGLTAMLIEAGQTLRDAGLPGDLASAMEGLAGQVDRPCVVAVVGRMKAGKSTFINALLEEDLARVGATETTATINHFRYGIPNPDRPVRCHWRNGSVTSEGREFAEALQGNDLDTLQRAEGIKHLEYILPNPYLERVTLVDTPGTSAVIDEHGERTAEFLALQKRLRDRHNEETVRLGSEAAAVVYLVGQVARVTDQAFLEEFREATGGQSRALNAVGVLAKVDVLPGVMERRHELADKIAGQLKDTLNTVVPVSAGIRRAVDRIRAEDGSGVARFLETLKRIPERWLSKLLDSEEFFRELESDDCPVGVEERERLLSEIPWGSFTALARTAAEMGFEPNAVEAAWDSLSGFDRLREVLDRHLFQRAHLLRCYQVVRQARRVLDEVRYRHLPERRQQDRKQKARLDQFLDFVRGAGGDPAVAKELEEFLCREGNPTGGRERIETVWKQLDLRLTVFSRDLEAANADFEALQMLERHAELFTAEEFDELRGLFGLYGSESDRRVGGEVNPDRVAGRQRVWMRVVREDARLERRIVAERAVLSYGSLANP